MYLRKKKERVRVFLGIGTNLGNRYKNIKKAIILLKKMPDTIVKKISGLYETIPMGGPKQKNFINGVIKIETRLPPLKLLKYLKNIEKVLGRKKMVKNGPRPIDLDILFYGDEVINSKKLKIPHSRMFEREFVLKPLRDII
ncbi:MAG: 2-amino-4-hydroxy-6-hydroxymethyldihydropteridine diphosphokinase [Candidatus Omnitrophica bacterium]|nr:2-amino-4-hydroxy-6-hydroxymethyldihydropteridine diphosphokinase [Candidatus Omnitrophota bacterium]